MIARFHCKNRCQVVSDIFIVRDWDSGQPLTIIRRICLNDVYDQIVSFMNLCFSNLLVGASSHIRKRYGQGHQALKVSDVSKVPKASMYGLTYRALCKELGTREQGRGHVQGKLASAALRRRA